ncbi:uncharacterized protein LOC129296249 [Prosopis cineraria]|uniref:uncharacterized protein LOC129296249 n=1 Tax=Prosopis cineraria TaxID=364024 RepID=UPI00240E9F21|nr:uncharacterized protein LOC129296249 [Prosopis cineraria]
MRSGLFLLYLTLSFISLIHCDAERSMRESKDKKHGRILAHKHAKKLRMAFKHFELSSLEFSNAQSVDSSSPLPPYESLAPIPLQQNSPPFGYPPPPPMGLQLPPPGPTGSLPTPTPQSIPNSPDMGSPLQNPPIIIPGPPGNIPGSPGSTTSPPSTIPSPSGGTGPNSPEPIQNPPIVLPSPPGSMTSPPSTIPSPSGGIGPGSPEPIQNPPSTPTPPNEGSTPGSPEPIQNPPIVLPSPPGSATSPPGTNPSPSGGNVPSPTVFEPPVVFPPPSVPPPPGLKAPSGALWCVAKPSVPDPILQEAMNYACGLGGDCDPIRPNGPCFEPDTVIAHTSFAFNGYWQNSKASGGTCDFGGTGMLVSEDPSYDGCHFVYS